MGAVLLDLDRTLVDLQSFTDYDTAWADVRELVDPDFAAAGPLTTWPSATRACMGVIAAIADAALWQTVSSAIERHERAAIGRSVAMPHVAEFLAATADRPRAVITLLPASVARDVLAAHGIAIDVIVGRDPHVRPKPSGDGLCDARQAIGPVVSVAREQLDATARDVGEDAVPVELGLVDPLVAARRLLNERGQLGIGAG